MSEPVIRARGRGVSEPVIRARGVTVELDGRTVLADVSLDVIPGEVLALVGPNGAGKSTLLSVLSGERAPSAGHVVVDERDIRSF